MSLAKLLDRLHGGDAIIVPGGNVAPQAPRSAGEASVDAVEGSWFESRGLLRNLIAARRGGGKK